MLTVFIFIFSILFLFHFSIVCCYWMLEFPSGPVKYLLLLLFTNLHHHLFHIHTVHHLYSISVLFRYLEREITVCDIWASPACERFWMLYSVDRHMHRILPADLSQSFHFLHLTQVACSLRSWRVWWVLHSPHANYILQTHFRLPTKTDYFWDVAK